MAENYNATEVLINEIREWRTLSTERKGGENITTFSGDRENFESWMKALNKDAILAGQIGVTDRYRNRVAFLTSTGIASDFIEQQLKNDQTISWANLEILLTRRFGDLVDSRVALAELKNVFQGRNESIQLYGDRFIRLVKLAFKGGEMNESLESVLIRDFVDGMRDPVLKKKMIKYESLDLDDVINKAVQEEVDDRLVNLRLSKNCNPIKFERKAEFSRQPDNYNDAQPMEVDQMRKKWDWSGHKREHFNNADKSQPPITRRYNNNNSEYYEHRNPHRQNRNNESYRQPTNSDSKYKNTRQNVRRSGNEGADY